MLAALSLVAVTACGQSPPAEVRAPAVAGQFYPGNPAELRQMVSGYLSRAEKKYPGEKPIALIAPHAGYVFSGQTAAWAYKQIDKGDWDTVVLLGLAHRYPLSNEAALYGGDAFHTPLGDVPIDKTLTERIMDAHPAFNYLPRAHQPEHSLEVHLPFLQVRIGDFSMVPILLGNPPPDHCKALGEALAGVLRAEKEKRILILASADLTHYPPDRQARTIDHRALEYMAAMDPAGLYAYCRKTEKKGVPNLSCVTCSEGAVMTAIYAAKSLGADRGEILHYSNSSDSPYGEPGRVVGYGAVALYDEQHNSGKTASPKIEQPDPAELLRLTRRSVEYAVRNHAVAPPEPGDDAGPDTSVFVTLEKNGRLRGCIGSIRPRMPLKAAIKKFALSAALQDHRFPPVTPEELDDITVELSILSPLEKADSYQDVVPHKHGVIIERGMRTGVFLPQVWEHFHTRDAFLSELASQKAGLPRDAWKDPKTTLYLFTVHAYKEEKRQHH